MIPTIIPQLPGEAGTMQSLGIMRRLVNKAYVAQEIRDRAFLVAGDCNRSSRCEDFSLLAFVSSAVRYFNGLPDAQSLHDPLTWTEARLRAGAPVYGQCTDSSMYLAALLKAAGHSPEFAAVARNGRELHHVFVRCHGNNLDPTMRTRSGSAYAGRDIFPPPVRIVLYPI